MKVIDYLNKEEKNKVDKLAWNIVGHGGKTTTYIRIGDDGELNYDDFIITGSSVLINKYFDYLELNMPDLDIKDEEIKAYMPIINYIAKEEGKEDVLKKDYQYQYNFLYFYILNRKRCIQVLLELQRCIIEYNKYQD